MAQRITLISPAGPWAFIQADFSYRVAHLIPPFAISNVRSTRETGEEWGVSFKLDVRLARVDPGIV